MPFFPRILVHLVGLDLRIVQRQRVGGLQRLLLEPVPQSEQVLAVSLQRAGQACRGRALRDAAEDQEELRRSPVRLVQDGPGEGVEDAAAGATVVQDRVAGAAVDAEPVATASARAGQAVGVEDRDELLVAGVLVHELGEGEVHGQLRCEEPGRDADPPSLPKQGKHLR
jgi:hypothetical protein